MSAQAQPVSPASSRRFFPGKTAITCGVDALIQQGQFNPVPYLHRHLNGDWGDLNVYDKRQNDAALESGAGRLFSAYQIGPSQQLWIITEWDRSVTTLLLPSEY